MIDKESLHAIIDGRVQGVYFRAFVQQHARALGLTGYVRNLPEGQSVEVYAEGERERLEDLVKLLSIGPMGARVDNIDTQWTASTGDFPSFEVRY